MIKIDEWGTFKQLSVGSYFLNIAGPKEIVFKKVSRTDYIFCAIGGGNVKTTDGLVYEPILNVKRIAMEYAKELLLHSDGASPLAEEWWNAMKKGRTMW